MMAIVVILFIIIVVTMVTIAGIGYFLASQ